MGTSSIPAQFTEAELKLLQVLVYQECGMHFDERRAHFLQDRLQRRLRACQLESFYSYYRLLTSREGRGELAALLEANDVVPRPDLAAVRVPRQLQIHASLCRFGRKIGRMVQQHRESSRLILEERVENGCIHKWTVRTGDPDQVNTRPIMCEGELFISEPTNSRAFHDLLNHVGDVNRWAARHGIGAERRLETG